MSKELDAARDRLLIAMAYAISDVHFEVKRTFTPTGAELAKATGGFEAAIDMEPRR